MLRFAVIGTNWISHSFCQAAHSTNKLKFEAVYSRSMTTAEDFASQYQAVDCYDDLNALAESPTIDAVYIASPNAMHAPQIRFFLEQGKHVICEKPIVSNIYELNELIALAIEKQVVLMEAMKTRYMPNLEVCRKALSGLGKLQRAFFSYCQHSSRYQRYLNGDNPNTFNPAFSNGSLMESGDRSLKNQ